MKKDIDKMIFDAPNCPLRNVLDKVGNKWSLITLILLNDGTLRFMEIKRKFGDITQRVLTQTLRGLEQDGYISRKVLPTSPPTVEYTITPFGTSLLESMFPMFQWAQSNYDKVLEARTAYDHKASND